MTPPYKFVDEATGETIWEAIDTAPGNLISVWSGSEPAVPLARISPGELMRPPDGGVLPPDPTPPDPTPPATGAGMDYPTNEDQLRDALSTYVNELRVGQFDGRVNVDVSRTIEIPCPNSGNPWGVQGNFAKLNYTGAAGGDLLRFVGTRDFNNRGLTVTGLYLNGNDKAGALLKLSAPLGDYGPIYQFNIRDVYAAHGRNGIWLEGGVYEGQVDNAQVENCSEDGIVMQHMNLGQPGQAVVSNIHLNHVNSSRNLGAGLRTVYSVYIVGGSFVLNGKGIVAPDGLRSIAFVNFENTAGPSNCAIDLGSNGYGTVIDTCEGSSDGSTHCRKWDGTKWVDVGAPLLYLVNNIPGMTVDKCHMSYYGSGSNPLRVIK